MGSVIKEGGMSRNAFPASNKFDKREGEMGEDGPASSGRGKVDVHHYEIALDLRNLKEERIEGRCSVEFTPLKSGLDTLRLDLLSLRVDSVTMKGKGLGVTYNDTVLRIDLPDGVKRGSKKTVKVYYGGHPVKDESGWGGFYFSPPYAFNLGIGFEARPHNYGRVWFPCVDNFTEKATYGFDIRIPDTLVAVCNGRLRSKERIEGGRRFRWELNDPIPSYLASVAVGPYKVLRDRYTCKDGRTIPVTLAFSTHDSVSVRAAFASLAEATRILEERYGTYQWSRLGYVGVPFSGGAMEHATNIAFPISAMNAPAGSRELMAHELAHSWWGNLVTCSGAKDMWINEGMATFSEFLVTEGMMGDSAYQRTVRRNHKKVLYSAHKKDGGRFRAVHGVPHEHTYGSHVYDKGADVLRFLRTFLGDEDFFSGLRGILRDKRFGNIDTKAFRDRLKNLSDANVDRFFQDWFFHAGYPHFSASIEGKKKKEGAFAFRLSFDQKGYGSDRVLSGFPLPVKLLSRNGEQDTMLRVEVNGASFVHRSEGFPFEPEWVVIDPEGRVPDASLRYFGKLSDTGRIATNITDMQCRVRSLDEGPVPFSVEHHLIAPGGSNKEEDLVLSAHFWEVQGNARERARVSATIEYSGMDIGAVRGHKESEGSKSLADLRLYFRKDRHEPWRPYGDYLNTELERKGDHMVIVPELQRGQYCFGHSAS